jgi:hypothetical protein
MIRLRNAQFSDYAAIAKLHTDNWKETYRGFLSDHYLDHEIEKERLDTWYKRLPDSQIITVALSDDLIVGFCYVYKKMRGLPTSIWVGLTLKRLIRKTRTVPVQEPVVFSGTILRNSFSNVL